MSMGFEAPLHKYIRFLCDRYGIPSGRSAKLEQVGYSLLKKLALSGEYDTFLYVVLMILGRGSEANIPPPVYPIPKESIILYADVYRIDELADIMGVNEQYVRNLLLSGLGLGADSENVLVILFIHVDRDLPDISSLIMELKSLTSATDISTDFFRIAYTGIDYMMVPVTPRQKQVLLEKLDSLLVEELKKRLPIIEAKFSMIKTSTVTLRRTVGGEEKKSRKIPLPPQLAELAPEMEGEEEETGEGEGEEEVKELEE